MKIHFGCLSSAFRREKPQLCCCSFVTVKILPSTMDDTEFNQTNIGNASFSNRTDYHLIPNFTNLPPYVILSVSGTCANLLVIICIVRNKKLHRPANYYIASLCANNIICSVFSLNGTAIYYTYYGWPFGLGLCRVWALFDYTTPYTALIHLSLLAYDRHEAITNPLNYSSPTKIKRIVISLAIVYGLSLSTVLAFNIAFVTTGPDDNDCYYSSTTSTYWLLTVLTVGLVIPFLSIFLFYIRCVLALHRHHRKIHPVTITESEVSPPVSYPTERLSLKQRTLKALSSATESVSSWFSSQVSSIIVQCSNSMKHTLEGDNTSAFVETSNTGIVCVSSFIDSRETVRATSTRYWEERNLSQLGAMASERHRSRQQKKDSTTASKNHREHFRHIRTLVLMLVWLLILEGPYVLCSVYTLILGDWVTSCTNSFIGDYFVFNAPYYLVLVDPLLVIFSQKEFRKALIAFCRGCCRKVQVTEYTR